jgi:hypothetical protein
MRAGAATGVAPQRALPIRLRHVLGLLVAGLLVRGALPRLRAAWQLHSVATAFADYALCMVGPTGPALLRDNPTEFRRLARRRLIGTPADDRPFARCAPRARDATDSSEIEHAHRATAASFVEYGLASPGAAGSFELRDLSVTTEHLADLSEQGWPFVRGGYTALVQPSAYAAEASHPAEMPRPGLGRGAAPARTLSRCETPEATFVLGLSADRKSTLVRSVASGGITSDAILAPAGTRVFAIACDPGALVVAWLADRAGVAAATCTLLGGCAPLPLPRLTRDRASLPYPLDVARVAGTTVVALSTRDRA